MEALTGMTRIFAGPAAPLQSMTTAQHRHTFLEAEPGIFFVLVRAAAPQRAAAPLSALRRTRRLWRRRRRRRATCARARCARS